MPMASDNELYNAYLSGDSTAYDELMIRYGDSLTFFLYGYLHNWEDAEDLMIEAFARIMVKKPFIGKDRFQAYLYKTGRNLAIRFGGKKSRMETFSLDGMEAEIKDKTDIEKQLHDEEKNRILHLCLERIDPELREVLWLVYVEGMSYADAAAVMKVTKKRIDRLIQKGKEHLRLQLDMEGIYDAYE
jgi:RNA polymerase sigma-70 factor (ECF subfamily)